jgi:hypothetical protein
MRFVKLFTELEFFCLNYFRYRSDDHNDYLSDKVVFATIKTKHEQMLNQESFGQMIQFILREDDIILKNQTHKGDLDKRITYLENSLHKIYNFYHSLNYSEKKHFKSFLLYTVKYYARMNHLFNRADLLEIAYLLYEFEYNTYVQDTMNDFFILQSKAQWKIFIRKRFGFSKSELLKRGHWGSIDDLIFVECSQINDEDTIRMQTIQRKKKRRVRLNKKIDWLIDQSLKMNKYYKTKYAFFLRG